jgi:LuxR family transcriptional regulator, maltose regulon positive regulatory protein
MSPNLQVYLLGSFRLAVNGRYVPDAAWQKRKAKLLVQLLALQPTHELRREELAEILFPETDEKTANANFYRILYAARRALEPQRVSYTSSFFLVGDGTKIKLTAANGVWVDADEFEQQARAGLKTNNQILLEAAARLYTGDLLADEPFEEWVMNRRELLKMLFYNVLHLLAQNAEKRRDIEKSHFWLDKILLVEPADEKAHRAKMRLFCRQGERFRALRQYETCVEVLRRELAVEPEEETKRLRREIGGVKRF